MPLKLEIKKLLSARSDRVKSVDFHPTEPWVLAGLYSGAVMIWDYTTQALVRQMEVSNLPIRCARFVLRRQWIVVGCDDMTIKVLNYNTLEKIKSLEGHTDYIRYISVHPTLPLLLSSSDDMSIKLWNWEKGWSCVTTFEGHSHYVMMVQWNPKENTTFASASLDRSIKVWGVSGGGSAAHFTLSGHQRGVNSVDYAASGEKPYLVSGSDDKTVRVWDYQTKQCVHVLEGHSGNVSTVCFHPALPLIVSGSEDGVCKLWHSTTYRLESSLNYMLDRLWSISTMKESNAVALGFDEGTVVVKLGSDEPVVSFCGGKLIWAKGVDIQTVNLKQIEDKTEIKDGEVITNLPLKDMGACELFPQSVSHHPSGRMFAVCGDGEYVIYTAQALRNKSFGQALGFAWSPEGHYATRDGSNKVTIFHNYKEAFSFKADFQIDEICSGELLAVRGPEFIVFYDWNEYRVIRRIDVVASSDVFWSESGKFVAIPTNETLFVLAFNREAVVAASVGGGDPEEGIEIAFELHNEVQESVKSGVWVSDNCFAFVNDKLKLNTLVGGMVEVVAHLDHHVKILGYLPEHQKIYCCDKSLGVTSFDLDLNLVRYKSAISCNDIATAESLFGRIPASRHTDVARFLEAQGYKAEALEITKDADHKFDLALGIGNLSLASSLVDDLSAQSDRGAVAVKRKLIGDKAIEAGDLALAESSFLAAKDASSLLLLASCSGDEKLLTQVASMARSQELVNVELMARTLLGDSKGCVDALLHAQMTAEAVLYARSHCPEMLRSIVPKWKEEIAKVNPQIAKAIADPLNNPELFGLPDTPSPKFHSPSRPVAPPPLHSGNPLPEAISKAVIVPPSVQAGTPSPELVSRSLPTPPTSARSLPTPPAIPGRSTTLRGPPPLPVRTAIPTPPTSARGPEVQVPNPSPESQQPVPRAPESTNQDVDGLL